MQYSAYIKSNSWRMNCARRAELAAAGHRCRICNSSVDGLECHHRSYQNFGHENPDDLTALCPPCHRLVTNHQRGLRYARRQLQGVELVRPEPSPSSLFEP